MSIWLVLLLGEIGGIYVGYYIGMDRGMKLMENKRGRRRAQ